VTAGSLNTRWQMVGLWATGIAAVGYAALTTSVGVAEVASAVRRVGAGGLAVALALSLANYGLRFARWEAYLTALGHRLPRWTSLRIYLAGFAWTVTPAKAGEALRGMMLERLGVPFKASVAAFLSERISDLAAIVLMAMLGLAIYPESRLPVVLGLAAALGGWYLLSQPRAVDGARRIEAAVRGRLRGFVGAVADTLEAGRRCHGSGLVTAALALSLAAWAAEAVALYLVLHWMGAEVSLVIAVFAYALAVLAGALSFVPGGLGGTEAVMIGVLLWQQVPMELAVAATLLIRMTTLWFAVVIGMGMLATVASGDRA
jgi:uncharacterized membrane protein YbhN (UPF0104 family)